MTVQAPIRRSRWREVRSDADMKPTPRTIKILQAFNHYTIVPTNILYTLTEDTGAFDGFLHLLKRMYRAGLLTRRSLQGQRNNYERLNYSRSYCGKLKGCNSCGYHYLLRHNQHAFKDHNVAQHEEQSLIDLSAIATEVALRSTPLQLTHWDALSDTVEDDDPHHFKLGDVTIVPDGNPFAITAPETGDFREESILFLTEVVRTNNLRKEIAAKIKAYKEMEGMIKERYGYNSFFLRWITRSEHDANNILKWIKEEIGECKWMLVAAMVDHIQQNISTPQLPLHLVEEPWRRAYKTRFSIKELRSV